MSILEFLGILRSGPSSFAEPGHETIDLGIKGGAEEASVPMAAQVVDELPGEFILSATRPPCNLRRPDPVEVSHTAALPTNSSAQSTYRRNALPDLMQSQQWNLLPPGGPDADIFSPSFALDDLEPLRESDTMDLVEFDLNHGFLDIDGWDYTL